MKKPLQVVAFFVVAAFLSSATHAQSLPALDKLPADTHFYVAWRGTGSLDQAKATNSLLRLWNDPDFAPVREELSRRFLSNFNKSDGSGDLNREEAQLVMSLLSNPAVIGFSGSDFADFLKADTAKDSKDAKEKSPAQLGFFMILDVTGKLDVVRALNESTRKREKPDVERTRYQSGAHTIEVRKTEKSTNYETFAGNYFITSDKQETLEELARRYSSSPSTAPTSIATARGFAGARQFAGGDALLEMYFRVPDLSQIPIPPQRDVDVAAMIRELHFERVHAVTASLNLAGESSRIRFAMLGDASPGSLFDFVGDSSSTFTTLHAAPPGASYNAFRVNFEALYNTVRAALLAGMSREQAGNIDIFEGAIGMQIGMPIRQALAAVTGEFAGISEDAGNVDPLSDLYVAGVRQPEDVVKLFQALLGPRITSEDREGDVTYFAITMPYSDPKSQTQRTRFYHVGITPKALIGGPRKAQVREAVARLAAGGAAGSVATLASDAQFARARARVPATLTGLSYADLSRVKWADVVVGLVSEAQKNEKTAETASQQAPLWKTAATVAAKYLRSSVGGWWKDRNGVFMEAYLD